MPLQLFNPWNDLALAANDPHYTPPASALQMAADLADLSSLWSSPGDLAEGSQAILPWGWSPLQVQLLREAGVVEDYLPTQEQLVDYRAFASRQTAVRLLAQLRDSWPEAWHEGWLVGESSWCTTEDEVVAAQGAYGRVMLKAPWSGSGRGVHPTAQQLTEKDWAWIRRSLKRQGGVEVEPIYNKVLDFAMEFWAERGQARYEGLSLFSTTDGGVYSGNLVASEAEKERRLAQYVSLERLQELREHLIILLNNANLPTWYRGPLGIDMLICQSPLSQPLTLNSQLSTFSLHPFIELNLRMTMGWLAILLARRQRPQEVRLFRIIQENGRYRYEIHNLPDWDKQKQGFLY